MIGLVAPAHELAAAPAPAPVPANCGTQTLPGAPRTALFIAVKRTGTRLPSPYGHWWIEIDRKTSYGWSPDKPLRLRHWLTGTGGCLNGTWLNPRATERRDALHRLPADHKFHPVLTIAKTDDELRRDIAAFAAGYQGRWEWQWPWTRHRAQNCRTFQLELFDAVGLNDPAGAEHTHGSGCPVLYPARTAAWAMADAITRTRRKAAPPGPSPDKDPTDDPPARMGALDAS
jgi:hypothetical protein